MIVIVMGVVGSGKTTVGSLLAAKHGWRFADADDFHSPANKEKMRRGIGLTDADRAPWLAALREGILHWIETQEGVVLACSALKESYRDELAVGSEVKFVYLKGSRELIQKRLDQRHGHFASASILDSQMQTLEEPTNAIIVDIAGTPEEIVKAIDARLTLLN